ncbi:MAG: hypothetical protein KDC48_14765, partial [Planctomycetes bacterium]|nr:hypothetical protein [Planctomycetota bacterium]
MSLTKLTRRWALPALGGGLAATLCIVGTRMTGWSAFLVFGVGFAAVVGMCVYGVICERHAWSSLADPLLAERDPERP